MIPPGTSRRARAARTLARRVAALAALASLVGGLGPAAAQDEETLPPLSAELLEERLDPRLALVVVEGDALRAAEAAYEQALFDLAESGRAVRALQGAVDALAAERRTLLAERDDAAADLRRATVALEDTESAIRESVVDAYMGGSGPADRMLAGIDPERATDAFGAGELVDSSTAALLRRRDELQANRADAAERQAAAVDELARVATETVRTQLALEEARTKGLEVLGLLPTVAADYLEARLTAPVARIDVPLLALDAYLKAADRLAAESPGCGVTWWALAAVGRVESDHGRMGGRTLRSDGTSDPPVHGVALNGTTVLGDGSVVANIPDSDGGALDGDPTIDRAVGPMQFIPSTWAQWGADNSGDGIVDPHNIHDAAYSAARYLCAVSGELRTEDGMRRAYFGYNHRETYVQRVYELAVFYSGYRLPR